MIQARSIGKRAGAIVARPPLGGRVLASFSRVCDLLTEGGNGDSRVVALAWDGVTNGPLNILLDDRPGAPLPAGTRFVIDGTGLRFLIDPPIEINLAGARAWDACPDWRGLAERRGRIVAQAGIVAGVLEAEAHEGSLARAGRLQPTAPNEFGAWYPKSVEVRSMADTGRLPPTAPNEFGAWYPKSVENGLSGSTTLSHLGIAARAIMDLREAHARNDLPTFHSAASRLCGLGPGLTPAGDDWLAGWLLGLRLHEDDENVRAAGEAVLAIAQGRTTVLSRAFLACAAAGEVDENWQALLSALADGPETRVVAATRSILAHGATSGADMLAGFLSGLNSQLPQIHSTRRLYS